MKKILLTIMICAVTLGAVAQTVVKGTKVPQLNTQQRDLISAIDSANAKGQVIYNLDSGCLEYWNGKEWISLCAGSSEFRISEDASNCKFFAADGHCNNGYTIEDPDCRRQGNFTLTWISGNEFIDQFTIDQADDSVRFVVRFQPNDRASGRSAVLMVTSSCGNSNVFTFSQLGDDRGCNDLAADPKILGENSASLCENGAAYLYLDGRPSGLYIWTLNGMEVGYGTEYIASQSGRYIVYANKIGCTDYKPDTLILSVTAGSAAPQPVSIVVGQNNGYVCSDKTTVLYAQTPAAGTTLAWYKDGKKQNVSQTFFGGYTTIQAGVGTWFVLVENGGCSSVKSNELLVLEDITSGAALTVPEVTVNGSSANPVTVCSGSVLLLEVSNATSYPQGTTFTWYVNNTMKGAGIRYELNASQITTDFLLQCRVSGTGCSSAGIVQVNVTLGNAPSTTRINSGQASASICGNNPAILNAGASAGAGNYKWYLGGAEVGGGAVNASHNADVTGVYTVRYRNGSGCWSALSDPISVIHNGAVSLQWGIRPVNTDAIVGTSKTYSVIAAPTPDSYVWTSSDPDVAAVTATGSGSSASVDYLAAGEVRITVSAANACGKVSLSSDTLNVIAGCMPITSVNLNPSGTITKNLNESGNPKTSDDGSTLFTAMANNGSPATSYEWFVDGVLQSGKTSSTFTYNTPAATASYSITARAYNNCTGTPGDNNGALSGAVAVVVRKDAPVDVSGNYYLSGKTCFDVRSGNDNTSCKSLASRINDFASGQSFIYEFINSANYKNLTFEIGGDNPSLAEVTYSGSVATVTFASNIASLAESKDKIDALKLKLIAKYTDNTNALRQIEIEIAVQDCSCGCPVKTINGGWLTFMCYNLGVQEDVKNWSIAEQMSYKTAGSQDSTVYGDLYQWGRKVDGHESRLSKTVNGPIKSIDENGQAKGSNVGKFISLPSPAQAPYDWRDPGSDFLWGKGRGNNPCPAGWRIPTVDEWASIFDGINAGTISEDLTTWKKNLKSGNYIRWSSNSNTKGLEVSTDEGKTTALFLPAAGIRSYSGAINNTGTLGNYWSITYTTGAQTSQSYGLQISRNMLNNKYISGRAYGYSIRCVAQ